MTPVVSPSAWVVIVPRFVVNRNSCFGRVAIVEAVSASSVEVAPIVLRVGDVGIVIKTIPVLRTCLAPSRAVRRLLLSLCGLGLVHDGESTEANSNDKKTTNRGVVLPLAAVRDAPAAHLYGLVTTIGRVSDWIGNSHNRN